MVKKECFGILSKVFPFNEQGYREVTPECLACQKRVACLKEALATKEGIEMRAEVLERTPVRGLMGRIQRWSQKKELSRLFRQGRK